MFNDDSHSVPHSRPEPQDPFELLMGNAARQYRAQVYQGPPELGLPTPSLQQEPKRHWQWLAAAAVLVITLANLAGWLPANNSNDKTVVIAHWQPETRQASPLAALAAARAALDNGSGLNLPERPAAYGFRLPDAPSKSSGFAAHARQSS